jgi:predicted O-methyltransferase YrrM
MLKAIGRTIRLFKSPSLAVSWTSEFLDDRLITPRHKQHTDYYESRQTTVALGIAEALGVSISEVEKELNALPDFLTSDDQDPGMRIRWSATTELASCSYALIRLLRPEIVVETGVGAGVSSWTILEAMDRNGSGRLVSIDLPTPNTELLPAVGYLVPEKLRGRWELRTGPSQKLLPQVLSELGEVDIFQHDSRHSYSNQKREYETAWPHIRPGGVLVSDDVSNDALHDACRNFDTEPTIIKQSKESPVGLVRKD